MFRKKRWLVSFAAMALLFFAATEGAVFSMAASAVYRLGTTESAAIFDENRIVTLPEAEQFSFLAAGDIASCRMEGWLDQSKRNIRYSFGMERSELQPNPGMVVTSAILSRHPDAGVLALGDLAYKRGEPVAFSDCYDPYWGKAKERTWPAPGNHEYHSLGAYGYFDYWNERAGPDRGGYYALQVGRWIILSLNSEIDASEGSEQADWIDKVLSGNPNACIGAYFHRPAYSAVDRKKSENAKLLFAKVANAGGLFVLNGHNHFFERTLPLDAGGQPSPDGTTIFVAGTGGKITGGHIPGDERTADLITGVPGVLKLDLTDQYVDWAYLTGNVGPPAANGSLTCI